MKSVPGDIVLVDLGVVSSGHEQIGIRPAIFVSEEGGMSILVPLSSNITTLRFKSTVHIEPDSNNKLAKPSIALAFQLRAVDSRRLVHKIGKLSVKDRRSLNRVLRTLVHI